MKTKIYNILYKHFPRQLATPKRFLVNNRQEFIKEINKNNGKKRIYTSVYNYTGNSNLDNVNLTLDKVFVDVDGGNGSFEKANKFIDFLLSKNYKFIPIFSGGGFHFYIFTKNYNTLTNINEKKNCLRNIHDFLLKYVDFDRHIRGDIARVATVINTYNTKRLRFCIPVTLQDFEKDYEFIKEKAKKQNFEFEIYGNDFIDCKKFKVASNYENFNYSFTYDKKIKVEIEQSELLSSLPPCIASLLVNAKTEHVGWRGRFLIISYLRDKGLPLQFVEKIILEYLLNKKNGKTEAYHCLKEEKQVYYLFSNENNTFPTCETVKQEGYCPLSNFCEFTKRRGSHHLVKIYW